MTVRILVGDVRAKLAELPDESVHCVVTSPPYFGLRDYQIEAQVWGAAPACEHEWGEWREKRDIREETTSGKTRTTDRFYGEESRKFTGNHQKITAGQFCSRCGAWRGSLGLEPTVDLYIEHLVDVFRAVHRVLRRDGTLWLNLGDSYAGSWGAQSRRTSESDDPSWHSSQIKNHPKRASNTGSLRAAGVKPKDLYGVPWLAAFALRADGWYLRRDIIWSKPNPMPESVTDRPTSAHEYLFLLSKNERYYYDAEAIREPCSDNSHGSPNINPGAKNIVREDAGTLGKWTAEDKAKGRNRRSVWEIATQPFPEAHFATFPPALVEPCILAGCPEGGTVLDPFGGSGTVGLVADRLKRDSILVELNPGYAAMARRRIEADAGLFAEVA